MVFFEIGLIIFGGELMIAALSMNLPAAIVGAIGSIGAAALAVGILK